MNRLVAPILSPCASLLIRTKVTLPRRQRTPEWHEAAGESKEEKLGKLNSEYDMTRTQLKLLRDRLKEKNTVTSFRGLLVEKKLSKQVSRVKFVYYLAFVVFL